MSDLARHDQLGGEAGEPAFPFALVLQPSPRLAGSVQAALAEGFDSLEAVEVALRNAADADATSVLFRVHLVPDLDPAAIRFAGVVRLRGDACRSLLGDRRLLFHHTMLTDDASIGGAGGLTAQRWLWQLAHQPGRRYEYEGFPALYAAHLPAWPLDNASAGGGEGGTQQWTPPSSVAGAAESRPPANPLAAFATSPPMQCPLEAVWEASTAATGTRAGGGRGGSGGSPSSVGRSHLPLGLLRSLLLVTILLPLGLLLLPLLLAAAVALALFGGQLARHRLRHFLLTLRHVARKPSPPPPHPPASLFDLFPFDNAAAQLLVARSLPAQSFAALSPLGTWGVWGHGGLSVFYDGELIRRDPATWRPWPIRPPVGLLQTVWGTLRPQTARASMPHAEGPHASMPHAEGPHASMPHAEGPHASSAVDSTGAGAWAGGCCPMMRGVGSAELSELEYGLPPLDGATHQARITLPRLALTCLTLSMEQPIRRALPCLALP